MKKHFLAMGAIAMLFAACSKSDSDTPNPGPDPKSTVLLSGYFTRTDSIWFEFDPTILRPSAARYFYSDDGDIGGYNEYYKYSGNQ